jgi:hypothetical protein
MTKIIDFKNLTAASESAVFPVVDTGVTQKVSLTNLRTSLFLPATETEYGVVKIGKNLSIDANGALSAADQTITADWNAITGPSAIINKPTLSAVALSNAYNDLAGRPNIPPAQIQSDWNQTDSQNRDFIKNKPTIAPAQIQSDWEQSVTGALDFIKNKPTIPAAQVSSDWNAVTGVARILNKPQLFDGNYASLTNAPILSDVATSGDYADLSNTPLIPVVTTSYTTVEPTSSIGQPGDMPGTIYANAAYVFVCFAEYDGESNIWAKTATVGDTW